MVELLVFIVWLVMLTPIVFMLRVYHTSTFLTANGPKKFKNKYGRKPRWYEWEADIGDKWREEM